MADDNPARGAVQSSVPQIRPIRARSPNRTKLAGE